MELDERIIEGKKPLGCFDLEEAKQFIGKKCYFGESLEYFSDLDVCTFGELKRIDEEESDAFLIRYGANYSFFIPAEWVKAEDIKYEPFKHIFELDEAGIKVGKVVVFKEKGDFNIHKVTQIKHEIVHDSVVTEIKYDASGDLISINLGGLIYSFEELFQHYLLEVDNEWKPFGISDSILNPSEIDNSDEEDEE